jgi:hypothetical protein
MVLEQAIFDFFNQELSIVYLMMFITGVTATISLFYTEFDNATLGVASLIICIATVPTILILLVGIKIYGVQYNFFDSIVFLAINSLLTYIILYVYVDITNKR